MTRSSILLAASAILATLASPAINAPLAPRGNGQITAIDNVNNFCFFLPRTPGTNISNGESDAIAFCTNSISDAPGANIFPSDFISSASYQKTDTYVQITGLINIGAYSLNPSDEGGQFDIQSPPGASCAGYSSFLNLVEPAQGDFCIRCCNDDSLCARGRSTAGCSNLIPGNYGNGSVPIITSNTLPATTTAPQTTTNITATTTTTSSVPTSVITALTSNITSSGSATSSINIAVSFSTQSVVAAVTPSSAQSIINSASPTYASAAGPSVAPATIVLTVLFAFAVALL